ncbi:MAG: ATP-binding cassette domain-containing protein [Ottowia sp.]|nr:ATP-binding cassette domain-containing protein [Ottowia sp.]MBQ9579362.1 ATP-binding cassette domain-containing protein [Ottowia sp.]
MLEIRDVEHRFGAHQVLAPISLQLAPGRCVALVGPSGCGKTTLLHLAAGLLDVQKGSITSSFARCALMFQQPLLLPWLTVLDNIALGLKAQRVPRSERQQCAAGMAAAMGLEARALRQFPQQLSGGMQSRAALARALVVQPDALLLDEPFAALDIGLKAHMHRLLQRQRQQRPLAALLITHDVTEAVTLADTVLVMAARPGRIVWQHDVAPDAAPRSDGWALQQAAALLAQPEVRQAFELPQEVEAPV